MAKGPPKISFRRAETSEKVLPIFPPALVENVSQSVN